MKRLSRARKAQLAVALFVVLVAVIVAVTVKLTPAKAPSLDGAFSDIAVTAASGSGPIYPWEQVRVSANWKVPDRTPAGTEFSLSWPVAQLKGVGGTLSLKNEASDVVETCTLGAASLDCVLTSYVTTHPFDIKGSLWFTLTQETIPENSTVTIPFMSGATRIEAPYVTAGSSSNSFTGITYSADVWVHDSAVTWYLYLPGGQTGQSAPYTHVVVQSTLGTSSSYQQTFLPGTFALERGTKLNSDKTWPIWEAASTRLYTVTPNGTNGFTFNAPQLAAGGWWRLVYDVSVLPSSYKGSLSDTAKTSWDTQPPLTTTHSEVYVEAGGTGSGQSR